MGGSKNKSPAQKERSQTGKKSDTKKKKGEKSEGSSVRAEIRVILTEQQAAKALKSSKVITVQDLARQTGVKISAANAFLRDAAGKGTVKRVGGYSGHVIYQFAG